jgi:hypothetical protein
MANKANIRDQALLCAMRALATPRHHFASRKPASPPKRRPDSWAAALAASGRWAIPARRDTLGRQWLSTLACLRSLDLGNSSMWAHTVSKRSGKFRLQNREAGVVPSEARQSQLESRVQTG